MRGFFFGSSDHLIRRGFKKPSIPEAITIRIRQKKMTGLALLMVSSCAVSVTSAAKKSPVFIKSKISASAVPINFGIIRGDNLNSWKRSRNKANLLIRDKSRYVTKRWRGYRQAVKRILKTAAVKNFWYYSTIFCIKGKKNPATGFYACGRDFLLTS